MPLEPTWTEIALRLLLTLLAGAIIGFDRGARGHAAGFRTTILVALAASVAMIQANILLPLHGKTSESFAVMDLMRLPLGILTGVGFIGAGTIVRKGELITGVTTAATLWLVTVIGLCFGGGQLALGTAATALAVLTLWILKWVDAMISREHRARLVLSCQPSWNVLEDVSAIARPMNFHARFQEQRLRADSGKAEYVFELAWRRPEHATAPLELLRSLDERFQVMSFELTTDNGR
ncbi:MAG TPA: MgtC/SapB family protein [Bradyrhizobium sp.]|jgi:putative Mg2+ transporter-C (MgtC) family protein